MEMPREESKQRTIGKEIKKWLVVGVLGVALIIGWVYGSSHKKESSVRIPIIFSQTGIPCLEVEIEKNKYLFDLDSGGDFYFSVKKEVIDRVRDKKSDGYTKFCDIKGNRYESPLTRVGSVRVNKICLSNVTIKEEDLDYLLTGVVLKPPVDENLKKGASEISGRVGASFLKGIDYWLIDFPNRALTALRSVDEIRKNVSSRFAEVAFEEVGSLIVVTVETGIGEKKFALDTGANKTILRTPLEFQGLDHHIFTTDYFKIGNHNYGATRLYLFDMSPLIRCDGLLGRDFFQHHAVYLDFKSKRGFIGP
jgi:hypothetical protein